MGELSQRIGKKLEHYGNFIFEHLENTGAGCPN